MVQRRSSVGRRSAKARSPRRRGAAAEDPEARDRTIVESTAEQLALDIASGVYAPGDRLPSVRSLATRHGINPSTMQVVLARLQSSGFIEARNRVGFLVRDVALEGGIETWRYVFRLAQRLPDRAVRLLEQTLATRRLLIAEALSGMTDAPGEERLAPVRVAVARLELALAGDLDRVRVAEAELHATRAVLTATGRDVLLAIFNSIGEILLEIPDVLEAAYAEPRIHLDFWRRLVRDWEAETWSARSRAQIDEVLRNFDAAAVDRFRELVG